MNLKESFTKSSLRSLSILPLISTTQTTSIGGLDDDNSFTCSLFSSSCCGCYYYYYYWFFLSFLLSVLIFNSTGIMVVESLLNLMIFYLGFRVKCKLSKWSDSFCSLPFDLFWGMYGTVGSSPFKIEVESLNSI
jgi:hypothetical protein